MLAAHGVAVGGGRVTALDGVRVLDLADESGVFATRILADLGADVLRVEPPDGGRVRRLAPFLGDEPGLERSLYHLHHNAGKRSITLDVETPRGAELLRQLASSADVLLETAPPGRLAELGLGAEALRTCNPALIYVSLTPFGQRGPWSTRKTSDLVAAAAGGLLFVSGDPADPPTQMGADASYKMASLVALAGCMIALAGRAADAEGAGTHLDISIQEAVAMCVVQTANPNHWVWNGVAPGRPGLSGALECGDGRFVTLNITADRFPKFLRWAKELGIETDLDEGDWSRARRDPNQRNAPRRGILRRIAASYARDELLREAWSRDMHALPIQSFEDLATCEHFLATGQFLKLAHEPLGTDLSFPRSALAAVTGAAVRRRAPLLGEHNAEIYGELGLGDSDVSRLAAERVI
jgi:crotonobetainyl-CoA:carnitine CoA-transferase CaiB-like acyl-CoA transferase